MIYFDNAATSFPKPDSVSLAVKNAIEALGNPGRGFYPLSINASNEIFNCRLKIAKLFNIDNPNNVAFTSNITESLNLVIDSLFNEKDHVITSIFEHNSVLRPLYRKKCDTTIIGLINNKFNYELLEKSIKKNTKAVIITHASNLTGDIIDLEYVSNFCEKNKILLIVDTAQTAGFLNIDLKKIKIDILCFTGHKSLLGPQGTGGICVSNDMKIRPVKVGGSGSNTFAKTQNNNMPDCFESGTLNSHSLAGLNAGIDFLFEYGIENIRKKELNLLWYFYKKLEKINNIKIYGNFEDKLRCPVISFNIGEISSDDVCQELYERNEISSRSGFHCAPLIHQFFKNEKQGAVRFSFSFNNTFEEIEESLQTINYLSKY